MAINFPSNPTDAQEVTEGNVTYVYNATKGYWESSEGSSSGASTTVYADMTALIAATGMSNGDQAFVTGNNNLYIYSGSGWYKVATVQQDAPSAITGVSGTYELAVDGTATTITAVSTDPEGFPLTWSYSASGLGSIATISQVDNVFTVTPSTTIADAGTFTLTINATDGVNGAVSTTTNLTLEFIIIVTNSKYTTLLATAVDTSDNNNITDSSSNNHSITVNGDAYAGTFSPYKHGGYSLYNTSTNHIQTSGLTAPATGDHTIEAWVYVTDNSANNLLWDTRLVSQDGTNGSYIIFTNSNKFTFGTGGTTYFTTTSTYNTNEWLHVALVRDGSTARLYINGVLGGSTSNSTNWNSGDINIGSNRSGASVFNGYIRDLRVANEVVYSGAFTPPTGSLTTTGGEYSDTTNVNTSLTTTQLLTCHLPYLADGSSNDRSITVTGSVETKPFSPYDYVEYSATDHGGSLHFNGTNSAVEIADNDDFDFGTGDLTIECWVYPEVTGNNFPGFLGTTAGWGSVAASGFRFDNLADSKFQMSWYGPGDPFLETQSTYLHDQWYHFVVTRTGGNTWRMFINGILEDVATNSTPYDICVGGHNLQVGGKTWDGGNGWFKGNVADLRLTKGSIVTEYQTSSAAIGTRIFTPRTTPITSSGSELHIKGTDASIIDKSQSSNLKLLGNTTGSTTQVKFANTKSIYADGSGDFVEVPIDPIGTGDFTVECWVYPTFLTTYSGIFTGATIGDHPGPTIANDLWWLGSNTGAVGFSNSGGKLQLNQWQHVAISREGSAARAFYNGTLFDTQTTAMNLTQTTILLFARYTGQDNPSGGYIQDFRLTKGLARYTASFTPPTAPLEG
jgi:hypothetical protein